MGRQDGMQWKGKGSDLDTSAKLEIGATIPMADLNSCASWNLSGITNIVCVMKVILSSTARQLRSPKLMPGMTPA
jgi:hypothetical protein